MQGLLEVLVRLADVLVVEAPRLHLEQRQPPLAGHGLRHEGFPRALDSEKKNSLRRLDPELFGRRLQRALALGQPGLQRGEAADLGQVLLGRDVLQQAVALEQLLLDGDDVLDVGLREPVVAHDGLAQRALGLEAGHAAQPVHAGVHLGVGELHSQRPLLADALDEALGHRLQLGDVRQREGVGRGQRLELGRQRVLGGQQHHHAPVHREVRGQIAQLAHDLRLLEEAAEILHEEERLAGHAGDVVERLHRLGGVVDGAERGNAVEALGQRPLVERHPQRLGHLQQGALEAVLLDRLGGDQRVSRLDQQRQVVGGSHGPRE